MNSVLIPQFIYGTAWKEELTTECVVMALRAGFRAIDTANQRKHYYEEGVGLALMTAYSDLGLRRQDLFLQTKFTFAGGQDHRKPYDENDSFAKQVQQSFLSSLDHLKTDYLDSYVLHGPSTGVGLTSADWEAWAAMEAIYDSGGIRSLGVSNVRYEQLAELYEGARIKPLFVQNRCYAETKWDQDIRTFCKKNEICYQGFSLLTANWKYLGGEVTRPEGRNIPQLIFSMAETLNPKVLEIVQAHNKNMEQVVFKFIQQVGMIPITGSRNYDHMKSDLALGDFTLTQGQLNILENIASLK